MEDYPNEPDDGHTHKFEAADDLPDAGTDATTVICVLCGMLSVED